MATWQHTTTCNPANGELSQSCWQQSLASAASQLQLQGEQLNASLLTLPFPASPEQQILDAISVLEEPPLDDAHHFPRQLGDLNDRHALYNVSSALDELALTFDPVSNFWRTHVHAIASAVGPNIALALIEAQDIVTATAGLPAEISIALNWLDGIKSVTSSGTVRAVLPRLANAASDCVPCSSGAAGSATHPDLAASTPAFAAEAV